MKFPEEFIWGAAAASYQIEGGFSAEGKGLSVWDMMCRQPNRIFGAHSGDNAIDHYHPPRGRTYAAHVTFQRLLYVAKRSAYHTREKESSIPTCIQVRHFRFRLGSDSVSISAVVSVVGSAPLLGVEPLKPRTG